MENQKLMMGDVFGSESCWSSAVEEKLNMVTYCLMVPEGSEPTASHTGDQYQRVQNPLPLILVTSTRGSGVLFYLYSTLQSQMSEDHDGSNLC